jgi:hypothetical protein
MDTLKTTYGPYWDFLLFHEYRVNPTLALPSLVLFHLSFVKKQFRSYGYATFFCLGQIKNNGDLNDIVALTQH